MAIGSNLPGDIDQTKRREARTSPTPNQPPALGFRPSSSTPATIQTVQEARAAEAMQGIAGRAASKALQPPSARLQTVQEARGFQRMQGIADRAASQAFVPPGGPRPIPAPEQPGATLGSVLAGGPGTAEVGGFRVSNLPDYSAALSQPVGAVPAPAPSASVAGAQGGYDQMPPDRVQQEIAARQPLLNAPGGSDTAGRLVDSGLNVARGIGQLALGGAGAVIAPVLDAARNGVTRMAGGNPETLPGGSSGFYNAAMRHLQEGWEPIAAGGQQIGTGIRGVLGAAQAQEGQAPASAAASPASAPTGQRKPAAPRAAAAEQSEPAPGQAAEQSQGLGFRQTGINGVVGRRNAQGVMEFSNAQADVAGASGERLVDGNIGDGIGGLTVGQEGDAQRAIERGDRAIAERAGMIQASRRGAIGDTGSFTVVEDGTRGRQADRDLEARRRRRDGTDVAMERNRLQEQELRQSGINSYLDRQLREREVANAEQTGSLQRQQAAQELQAGQLTLEQQRQIQNLRTRLADPKLDQNQRTQLERAYAALTTPAKDRYVLQDTVLGHDVEGVPITGKAALDVVTGQAVGQGQSGQASPARTSVSRADVDQTAKARGITSEQVIEMLKAKGVSVNG